MSCINIEDLSHRFEPLKYTNAREFSLDVQSERTGNGMVCILAGFIVCYAIISLMNSTPPHQYRRQPPPSSLFGPGIYLANSARKAFSAKRARDALLDPSKCRTIQIAKGSVGNLVVADCDKSLSDPLAWKTATDEEKSIVDARTRAFLEEEDSAVIMIFAPWCGHCKTAIPKFGSLSVNSNTPFALLNAEAFPRESFNPKNADHIHPIQYFPTFLVMKTITDANGNKKKEFEEKHMADIAGILDNIQSAPKNDSLQTTAAAAAAAAAAAQNNTVAVAAGVVKQATPFDNLF